MKSINFSHVLANFNKSYIKLGLVLALITAIGLLTVSHYGISVDERGDLFLLNLLSSIRIGGFMILGFIGLVSLPFIPRNNIVRSLQSYLAN
ncbi:MAG: hypothetical protein AB4290_02495 [Spirulina sp.]